MDCTVESTIEMTPVAIAGDDHLHLYQAMTHLQYLNTDQDTFVLLPVVVNMLMTSSSKSLAVMDAHQDGQYG
jgi:hypothetical protein